MEQSETLEQVANEPVAAMDVRAVMPSGAPPARGQAMATILPQADGGSCPTCGGNAPSANGNGAAAPSYVYAIGRIEPRFPSVALEKEFAQVTSRVTTDGLTDRQAIYTVLSQRQNRYLARQLCWVLTVQNLETYIVMPRDPGDFYLLTEAIRPAPSPNDLDVVIGVRGPLAPPQMCNGLMLPIVAFDQIYSFTRAALIESIPPPEQTKAKGQTDYRLAAEELFDRIMLLTDNAGATDEHRALNYLVMRYPAIYASVADAFGRNAALTAVDVRPSTLSGVRNIVDVIFSYTNRNTDVTEKFFCRVDVTEEFPFLVTKLSPYYDR